ANIPCNYLPRTIYTPIVSNHRLRQRTPSWEECPTTSFFRHVHRRRFHPSNERSLICSIIPPGVAHIHGVISVAFREVADLLWFNGLCGSIVYDFFVKASGKGDLYESTLGLLPLPSNELVAPFVRRRSLLLNCLTSFYSDLWSAVVGLFPSNDG